MISFLFFYFTFGVLLAAYLYLFEYEKPAPFINKIYKALDGERSWHYKLREKLVIPGAMLLITISWPVAIYMLIENYYKNRKNSKKKYEPQFTARIENIETECSVDDIEATNIYIDPENAVPRVPFGHLNKTWNDFINKLLPQDRLCNFKLIKNTSSNQSSILMDIEVYGYVIIRKDKVIAEFICETV